WKKEYEPIQSINEEWYSSVEVDFNIVELDALIKDAPIKKATGPSQISYEMLKHIGPKVKQL
ncbi:19157_t:CDS:1, partial [Gigaspora margarita]